MNICYYIIQIIVRGIIYNSDKKSVIFVIYTIKIFMLLSL